MGWTSTTHNEKLDYKEIKNLVMTLWTTRSNDTVWEAERTSIKNNVAYSIVHCENKNTGEKESFIAVTLIKQYKNANSTYEVSYKEMTEGVGPYYYDCPVSYIKKLGGLGVNGTNNETAKEWREKVLHHADQNYLLNEYKKNSIIITVNYNDTNYQVSYNKNAKKWIIVTGEDKDKYIPTKYINATTVNQL